MTKAIDGKDVEEYIGYRSEPTEWFTVAQDQIDEFAECAHDQQFIHVSPDSAGCRALPPPGGKFYCWLPIGMACSCPLLKSVQRIFRYMHPACTARADCPGMLTCPRS